MKFESTALGLVLSKLAGTPFYIRFHLTHRCNYRCRMCGQNHSNDQPELSLADIRIAAERIAQLKAYHLVLTGGEPFLRPDLPEIIAIFKHHHFSIRIQTNGGPHVTHDLLTKCAQAGLQDISVSIDTLNPDIQDHICQGHHVVENALRTLQMSRHILPHGISQANVVASAFNFTELPDLVRFFYSRGVYTYITPVMISPVNERSGKDFWFRGHDTRFRPEDMNPTHWTKAIEQLIELRRKGIGLTNSTRYLEDYRTYLKVGRSDWKCKAGLLSLDILPDGRVTVCKEKPALCNIMDHHFLDYIRSNEFRREAYKISEACEGCFYGEYREPYYAIHEFSVFQEWVRDWFRNFRHGMRFKIR